LPDASPGIRSRIPRSRQHSQGLARLGPETSASSHTPQAVLQNPTPITLSSAVYECASDGMEGIGC
jgi:hypothetical protein